MSRNNYWLACGLFCLLLAACSEEDGDGKDLDKPLIESGDSPLDEKKLPVHPWVYNQDFPIPGNSPLYDAHVNIPIPADIDPGDYHFMIRVTDRSGWQQLKAVNIKISDNK